MQSVQAGEGQPSEALNHIECKLQRLSLSLHPSAPPESIEEILKNYTDTLCSAQKQINFTTSLLQDILIFAGHDTTLTGRLVNGHWNYCRSNIRKQDQTFSSKIKRFTTTLITEAITSRKSWNNIKDLLWLKICNSNIHTSIYHFMEIQQKVTEYLATYIHHFKREAKRCNFMNNAATIRIFIKELKNAHNVAAHIYEKGPQTLTDAISQVEKLHAAQQLTATLIPLSTVNFMSHEENHFFQYQESGHIACHYPNVCCFECDEYGHIVVDCPHRIPPSGTPTHYHRPQSWHRHHNRSTSCHHPTQK